MAKCQIKSAPNMPNVTKKTGRNRLSAPPSLIFKVYEQFLVLNL